VVPITAEEILREQAVIEASKLETARDNLEARANRNDLAIFGGGSSDGWNEAHVDSVITALPTNSARRSPIEREAGALAALAAMSDCKPADPVEAMLLGQLLNTNATALEIQRLAWAENSGSEKQIRFLQLADKNARTLAVLVEALGRYRGKGQQRVTVEHVHINAGGQAVIGNVSGTGGGLSREEKDQSHGIISHAAGQAMPREIETERRSVSSGRRSR
jgi:hypothetical protein